MSGRQTVPGAVLVTGARGFVGSHLCRMLAGDGWRVLAASREPRPQESMAGVQPVVLPFMADPAGWRSALVGVDCVVHLAARVHQADRSRNAAAVFRTANVDASRFVAEQAARAGVRRLVFLSSIKVNGEGGTFTPYRANDPPSPADDYGRSKFEAEETLRDLCGTTGVELAIIRPPLVYGPGVRANFERLLRVVASGLPLPLGSVRNRRSMIGVANLTHFIQVCMTRPDAAYRTWLVSDGDDLSTPEVIEKLARFMHRSARLFPCHPSWLRSLGRVAGFGAEISRLCDPLLVDIGATLGDLGWRPPVSVDTGFARTVEAYLGARRS